MRRPRVRGFEFGGCWGEPTFQGFPPDERNEKIHYPCLTTGFKLTWRMPMRVEDLTGEALALPIEARALLADRLVESLAPAEDGYLHQLWVKEANRRLGELRSGEVESIPGEEAMGKLRRKYG